MQTWIKGFGRVVTLSQLFSAASGGSEARSIRDRRMSRRTLGWGVGLLLWGISGSYAGDGVVALQTADPSCPDDSDNIYVDCGNGTVTDNRTGLVWLKNANCVGEVKWNVAMGFVAGLSDKPPSSQFADEDCGLSDGSSPGDWRLPSIEEWEAMISDALGEDGDPDCTLSPPTITNDSGQGCWVSGPSSFSGVEFIYWSFSTDVDNTAAAFIAGLEFGALGFGEKDAVTYIWPVRGGQ